ncbi:MAG: NUDIX domain-containing protein [Caldilineaceae bacterium]|nr:NUDIX domain-containing protein [Caldilineaceae bacterium]
MYDATYPVQIPRRYPPAPLVGVAAAVLNAAGQVLLVQRGQPPRAGSWGLPGGLLDLGERLVDGVRREVREECGIEIEVHDLVAAFEPLERDADGRIEYHYIVLDYWAVHVSGAPVAQDDAAAVAWASVDDLDRFHLLPATRIVVEQAHEKWRAAGEEDADLG